MGILPAVFANPWYVALDVPGIQGRSIERGRQQQHNLRVTPHEMGPHGFHRASGPPSVGLVREDGPRLRQRVDTALLVLRRSERGAVVEIRASVPVAVPGELQHAGEPPQLTPVMLRTGDVPSLFAQQHPLFQDDDQEPSEPHALATVAVTDAIHAVVPVA